MARKTVTIHHLLIYFNAYQGVTDVRHTWLAPLLSTCKANSIFRRDLVCVDVMSRGIV